MENPEEILHSLEEFSKMKPKDIPRELEEYLCYVAKTGNTVYQWQTIKSLFREKLLNVITDFYESCPTVDIPPCPNVEMFNYELMKSFILEKLDTFTSAPFTVQRICELLTAPRKEYNRIDKYMRALEKNILVVSTMEPGNGRRRSADNRDGIVNGIENDNHDINVEEMDEAPSRAKAARVLSLLLDNGETDGQPKIEEEQISVIQENLEQGDHEEKNDLPTSSNIIECPEELIQQETIIACHVEEETEQPYISFDGEALVSCNTEPQEEIRHEVVETTEVNSSSAEEVQEEKLEEIEAEIKDIQERVSSDEEKEAKCETTATLEEPNEALPSIPCSELDDFPTEDHEKSEELTVSESGLPEDDLIQLEPEESVQLTIEGARTDSKEENEDEIVETTIEDAILREKILDEVEKGELHSEEKPSEPEAVEPLDEPKISSNDIPMEIDITDEPQREKIASPESGDEPTSTSADVTL